MRKFLMSILFANCVAAASAQAVTVLDLPLGTTLTAKKNTVLKAFQTDLISATEGPGDYQFGNWCSFKFQLSSNDRDFSGVAFSLTSVERVDHPLPNYPNSHYARLRLSYVDSNNKQVEVPGVCVNKHMDVGFSIEVRPATISALQRGFDIATP